MSKTASDLTGRAFERWTVLSRAVSKPGPEAMQSVMETVAMTPTEIIGIEAVDKLRAAGFEIVPKEPTDAMVTAGAEVSSLGDSAFKDASADEIASLKRDDARDIYDEMIAAAEKPA